MKIYIGEEIWDTQRILDTKTFQGNDQGKALRFCKQWLEGKTSFKLYTSGSTGIPKPIRIQRSQMQISVLSTAKKLNLQSNQKTLISLNTNYIAGKMMLVRTMEIGMCAYLTKPSANPLKIFRVSPQFDFMAFVPMQLQTILTRSPKDTLILNHAQAIIVGGAPINRHLMQSIQHIEAPVYATYGMTETVSHIALKRLNGKLKQDFYEILPNVTIGQDERNCLTICAPTTLGQKIITNDIVELVSKHQFRWVGRFDNMINSGGVKIHAEEIERIIGNILVSMCIKNRHLVVGVADQTLGQKAILCIEGSPLSPTHYQELCTKIRERIERYKIPKEVLFFEQFPTLATGKIARKKIVSEIHKSSERISSRIKLPIK